MKYLPVIVLVLVLAAGCEQKQLTYEQVESKLIKAMNEYLNKTGDGKVQFKVKEVVFFPETNRYLCEFKVNMKIANLDTIGTMKARISKDFKDVERTQ